MVMEADVPMRQSLREFVALARAMPALVTRPMISGYMDLSRAFHDAIC
jgi:hypothetical protein